MSQGKLELRAVRKTFESADVIKGVDLQVGAGELVVFVGPSGCGKSTLLRMIAGLEAPTSGSIHIGEREVTRVHPSQRGIAMVFQSYALYPHMDVAQNMGFALKIAGMKKAEIRQRVERAADILQLSALLDRKPRQLSGGQRQRVAIGRAIVREPQVFLFDEPLSNLDAALRGQMRVEIARLHARLGATMVYVTHDQVEAMTLASKIVVLNGGRIEQVGTPIEVYRNPANLFVAGFIGSPRMNVLEGRVTHADGGGIAIDLPGGHLALPGRADALAAGDRVRVGIRPEHLLLRAGGALRGQVELLERLGGETLVHLRLPGSDAALIAKAQGDLSLKTGQDIELEPAAADCLLFDGEGRSLRTQLPLAA